MRTEPLAQSSSEGLTERREFAHDLIVRAGELALGYFGRLDTLHVHTKGVQDMASEADVAVEALIRDELNRAFPGDGFLGEESGPDGLDVAEGIWVVDPIDGTQPFVSGLRSWCVSIAYVHNGRVQFGMVNSAAAGELFEGGTWFVATLNGQPISPSQAHGLAEGLTYLGASPRVSADQVVPVLDRLMRAHGMFVRGGSGALGLCDVACGRLIGYVEPHINSWDCLGALAVLQASGCTVSDYLVGDALLSGNSIVAGAPGVYRDLVSLLG